MPYIRWIGAFNCTNRDWHQSLRKEISLEIRERACEFLRKGQESSLSKYNPIGLLFNKGDISRKFSGDVYSCNDTRKVHHSWLVAGKVDQDSLYLIPLRKPTKSGHTEAFIRVGAFPSGIVLSAAWLNPNRGFYRKFISTVKAIADEFDLPILVLSKKGRLTLFKENLGE